MNVLQVENLIRSYRKSVIKESEEDVKVLKGISFQVAEGEFVGIMGKSGCGKTTLLKTLGMIDKRRMERLNLWEKIPVNYTGINLRISGTVK